MLVALVLALGACAGGGEEEAAPSTTRATTTEATTTTQPVRVAEAERGICESLIQGSLAQQDGDPDSATRLIGEAVLRATRARDVDAELAEQAALNIVAVSEGDQEALDGALDAMRRRCAELGLVDLR